MYINTVSIPSLNSFFRIACSSDHERTGEKWKVRENDHLRFYPRGSRALEEVADSIAKDKSKPVCFFPAYFCNCSLEPLRQAGARIIFYSVMDDLSPNWDDVRRRTKAAHPDIFVLVHTFGLIQDITEAIIFAKESGCVVIEDAAHVLMPRNDMGIGETIVLFCPHKLIPVPPISLLSVPHSLAERIGCSSDFAWRKEDWIWLLKRMLQKGIVALGGLSIQYKPRTGSFEGEEGDDSSAIVHPHEISRLGYKLLVGEQRSLAKIAQTRRDNFSFLARTVAQMPGVKIPEPFAEWGSDLMTAPYAFPLFVDEAHGPEIHSALWRLGIPAQTWPDLSPEVKDRAEEYTQSWRWRKRLLLLPLHQSLTTRQLRSMEIGLHKVLKYVK